uniref:Uncharacterized protein n=1 Tax=Fagus sylvatica TaxID=28930 RepID=A0A2N9GL62_FAGSY
MIGCGILKKKASAMIQATESKHKSAEAGLMTVECQVVELSEKYDREIEHSSKLWGDISALKAEVHEAQVAAQKLRIRLKLIMTKASMRRPTP